MAANKTYAFLLLTFLLSSFVFDAFAKTHQEALNQYFKAKAKLSSSWSLNIDTSCHITPKIKSQKGLKEKDRIHKLPGQPPVAFKQYGGYITIDESAGREFYYYFTEAQNPAKAKDLPLLLWLNGGPGCSSLGYGAMQELGPFRVGSDGKTLSKNKFAWNHAANVLFLETPAGVGFSYSNRSSDFLYVDRETAADNLVFLLNWLERFPEYKTGDFFIAGESYAGHFVPQLAHNILQHNKKAKRNIINLKGITIGNAVINDETHTLGMYEYWASHALISPELMKKIRQSCNFSAKTPECDVNVNEAEKTFDDKINMYNIYYPICLDDTLTTTPKKSSTRDIDPCSDSYTIAYLNRPEVQEAMHANVTKVHYPWGGCSDFVNWKWDETPSTGLPLLKELMADGIRVWKFSGDVDGRVPITSTQYSLEAMHVPIIKPWSAWYHAGEVAGYTQYYKDNLTFISVRGAGHQVPSYKAEGSLSLVWHFLAGTPLPHHQFRSKDI